MIGGKEIFKKLLKDYPNLFVNIGENGDFKTQTHRECFSNKGYINPLTFEYCCNDLSRVATQQLRHLTGNHDVDFNIGRQIYEKEANSAGYKAVQLACAAMQERNMEQQRTGNDPLQMWALKKCQELNIQGFNGHTAVSAHMKE